MRLEEDPRVDGEKQQRPDDGSVTPAEWGKKLYNQRMGMPPPTAAGVLNSFKESYGNMRLLTKESVKADAVHPKLDTGTQKQIVMSPTCDAEPCAVERRRYRIDHCLLETVSDYGRKVGAEDEGGSTTEEPTEKDNFESRQLSWHYMQLDNQIKL